MDKVGGFAVLAVLFVGCGSAFSSGPGDDGGKDAPSTKDGPGRDDGTVDAAGDGPGSDGSAPETGVSDVGARWSSVCPELRPMVGSACTTLALQCEYPDELTIQYDVACSTIFFCDATMKWSEKSATTKCRKDTANPAICLTHPTSGTCLKTTDFCVYSDEACFCTGSLMTSGASWMCDPPKGCPMPRPRVGSACKGNVSCEYVPCSYSQQCLDGAWQGTQIACGG